MKIRCIRMYNNSCLKCDCIQKEMVQIGAFVFCNGCWAQEFKQVENFDKNSIHGKIYSHWYKIYKEKLNALHLHI